MLCLIQFLAEFCTTLWVTKSYWFCGNKYESIAMLPLLPADRLRLL